MIYLDHAATTRILPEVYSAMTSWLCEVGTGNASSLHSVGMDARFNIEEARISIKRLINAKKIDKLIFTSGGTESDNLAVMGLVSHLKKTGKTTVLFSSIEHHAILKLRQSLAQSGIKVGLIPVLEETGEVCLQALKRLLKDGNVGLVSVMLANNEVGVIQDISKIASICHKHGAIVHTDAVQAVGHMQVDVNELDVDLLSMSGHKIGALQGIGALYVKDSVYSCMSPILFGGNQERGMRPGTESVPLIVGFGTAANVLSKDLDRHIALYKELKSAFIRRLKSNGCEFRVNSEESEKYLPNILSITVPGVESESLLRLMNTNDVCLSAASACSALSLSPSHVLTALGFSANEAYSTVRISFGVSNNIEEVEVAADLMAKNIRKLRSLYDE